VVIYTYFVIWLILGTRLGGLSLLATLISVFLAFVVRSLWSVSLLRFVIAISSFCLLAVFVFALGGFLGFILRLFISLLIVMRFSMAIGMVVMAVRVIGTMLEEVPAGWYGHGDSSNSPGSGLVRKKLKVTAHGSISYHTVSPPALADSCPPVA
jgi:hypothetical protein